MSTKYPSEDYHGVNTVAANLCAARLLIALHIQEICQVNW